MSENDLPRQITDARALAQQTLATLGGCAVLVGVEDYPAFPGQALLSGRSDVLTYWKVCRRLGYRAEDIRVRTSPELRREDIVAAELELSLGRKRNRGKPRAEVAALVEAELSGVPWDEVLGPATHAGIVGAVTWLAQRLVFTFRASWEGREVREEMAALPGLFAYSGHGAALPGDLALCPSDVGPGLTNAFAFADFRALIQAGDDLPGGFAPTDNLTVVLDCCFAAGADTDAMLATSLTPAGTAPPPQVTEIGSRVFCASGRDEQAYQAMLGGRWQGAFTWAFTRALEQWTTAPSGQFKKSTISHAELLFRARMLLEALSFPQHPVLVDGIGNLPVFWHRSDVEGRRATKDEPDDERLGVQLDPTSDQNGWAVYEIKDFATGALLAWVIAVHNDYSDRSVTFLAANEYWYINVTSFDTSNYPSGITITRTTGIFPHYYQMGRGSDFTVPQAPSWQLSRISGGQYQTGGSNAYGLQASISKNAFGAWQGAVIWMSSSGSGYLFGGPSGTVYTLSYTGLLTGSFYFDTASV